MTALDLFMVIVAWFWANVAGNLIASMLWSLPALAWHHRRVHRKVIAEHNRLYDDLADLIPEGDPVTTPVKVKR